MDTTTTGRRRRRPASLAGMQAGPVNGLLSEHGKVRAAIAEALGTCILVLVITSTAAAAALAAPLAGAPYGSLAVPAAGGLALAVLVASLAHVSGAHLNPAVTIGLAAIRRFPWTRVPGYVAAQVTGATAAAAVTWALYGDPARAQVGLAAPSPAAGVAPGRVFAAEAIGTFLLVLVVTSVTGSGKATQTAAAAAIGSALAAAILISGPVSGAGLNPARALGPMIVTGRFTDWWAYLTAPVIGAALAVVTWQRLLHKASTPEVAGQDL